jgi:hypothetical protein
MNTETKERSPLDEFVAAPRQELVAMPVMGAAMPQVIGAQNVPVRRDETTIRRRLKEAAALLGERAYYRWPVKNRKTGKTDWVEGVSIKGANALIMAIGNCRVGCPVVEDRGTVWIFHSVLIDYETGAELERSVQQRKSAGTMGDDAERRADIAYQIGISKAIRNATLNAFELYAQFLLDEAKNSLIETYARNLPKSRERAVDRLEQLGIEVGRVEAVLGRAVKDWLAPDLAKLRATLIAIEDHMATIDESFPPLRADKPEDADLQKFTASVGSSSSQPEDAAGGGTPPSSSPQPPPAADERTMVADPRERMIKKVIGLAGEFGKSPETRFENLDLMKPILDDELVDFPDFVRPLMETATKVAKAEIKPEDATKYLRSLIGAR